MTSMFLLRLSLRLSLTAAAGAGIVFIAAATLAGGVAFAPRDAAIHLAVAYGLMMGTMILLPRIRKNDIALLLVGIMSLGEIGLWCFYARPFVADSAFTVWLGDLVGIMAVIAPFQVDTLRRERREDRRAHEAVAKARDFAHRSAP